MLFKSYIPSTPEIKNLVHLYGCLKRVTGKDKPTKKDYYLYMVRKAGYYEGFLATKYCKMKGLYLDEVQEAYDFINEEVAALNYPSWDEIKAAVNTKSPERGQNVAYIIIFSNGGIKCGQTSNFVQRYTNIMKENGPIASAMYLPLDTKEEALIAENVLQNAFGHSRGMKKILGKMDYFECEREYAEKFIRNNKGNIYNSIRGAILGI